MSSTEIAIKRIKMLREVNNYTQQHVANELDISQNAYSLLEKGLTKLTLDRLDQIAAFYKVDVLELLLDTKNPLQERILRGQLLSGEDANTPPAISPLEKILYEKTISSLENNISKLYNLVEQLAGSYASERSMNS